MNIHYTRDISTITPVMLQGFFIGWPTPPTPDTHLKILQNSHVAFVAIDTLSNQVVGFINAISDGILSAYIPLLEVLPPYQNQGIGRQLVNLVLAEYKDLYMIDCCHDESLAPYYKKFGAYPGQASLFRHRNSPAFDG